MKIGDDVKVNIASDEYPIYLHGKVVGISGSVAEVQFVDGSIGIYFDHDVELVMPISNIVVNDTSINPQTTDIA